jgi:hypothetical protein
MVLIGLFYLSMEEYVLADFSWTRQAAQAKQSSLIGRTLAGVQVESLPGRAIPFCYSTY